jgi:type II secretory pathway component PulC
MKQLFNDQWLKQFNLFAAPIAIVWTLAGLSGLFLEQKSVQEHINHNENFFELFIFGEAFGLRENLQGGSGGKMVTTTMLVAKPHKLKAILRSTSGSFGVINDGNSSSVVALGGLYKKNYHLVALSSNTALLRGNGKSYRLRLGKEDSLEVMEKVERFVADPAKKQGYEWHTITHRELMAKMDDISKINQEIVITPQNLGRETGGFKVEMLTSSSLFAKLGVLQGDIISSVNNRPLLSYADALSIYNKLPQIRSIKITVLRNNQPKDLVYEVTR